MALGINSFAGLGRGAPGDPPLFNVDGTPADGVQATPTGVTPPTVQATGGGQPGFFDRKVNLPIVGEVSILVIGVAAVGAYLMFFHDDGKKR